MRRGQGNRDLREEAKWTSEGVGCSKQKERPVLRPQGGMYLCVQEIVRRPACYCKGERWGEGGRRSQRANGPQAIPSQKVLLTIHPLGFHKCTVMVLSPVSSFPPLSGALSSADPSELGSPDALSSSSSASWPALSSITSISLASTILLVPESLSRLHLLPRYCF